MKKKHRKPLDKNSHSSFSSIKIPMFFRMKFIQSFHHFPMDFPIIFLWISAKSELPRRCEPWADSSGVPWRNPWPPVMFGKSMGKIWDQMGKWWENDEMIGFFPTISIFLSIRRIRIFMALSRTHSTWKHLNRIAGTWHQSG